VLKRNFTYFSVPSILILAQLFAILFYLNANIVNIGGDGVAIPVLAAYVALSVLISFILFLQKTLFFRLHFIVFLIFLAWIAIRVILDYGDLEKLHAITIATTEGIFLFYLVGAFFSISYSYLLEKKIGFAVPALVVILFGVMLTYLLSQLFGRTRKDLFLISELYGAYQRPGNFHSISFILISAIFFALVAKIKTSNKKRILLYFWITIYPLMTVMALVSAQLFGSNSATAVVSGVSILTIISLFLMSNQRIYQLHANGQLKLPFSKQVAQGIIRFGIIGAASLVILISLLIQVTDFDIKNIRLLGFGSGSISSIETRVDIFKNTISDQISYAPIFGNLRVDYLTKNDKDNLHNFFPYIQANLGLIGTILILYLFVLIFRQLYSSIKKESQSDGSLVHALISFYFILILLFLLLFANLAVGVSWAVMWFAVGFISQPFGFKSRA